MKPATKDAMSIAAVAVIPVMRLYSYTIALTPGIGGMRKVEQSTTTSTVNEKSIVSLVAGLVAVTMKSYVLASENVALAKSMN